MNISSAVIKTSPEYLNDLIDELKQGELCEVHYNDETQVVVTLEGKNVTEEMKKLKKIHELDHVFSAQLMYSYSEEELIEAIEKLEINQNIVPEVLENDNIPAEKIKYQGDLKDC